MEEMIVLGIFAGVVILLVLLWIRTFMKGSLDILLNKNNFSDGENVSGKIILNVKKPLEKTGSLTVSLICEETSRVNRLDGSRGFKTVELTRKDIILDNKSSYEVGKKEYEFSIKIPSAVESTRRMKGEFMGGIEEKKLNWKVLARLEIPGFDIADSKRIEVF